jgi:predicted aspartyl protease
MLLAKLHKGNGKARYFEFLIDSGADYTLIANSHAYLLGLEYNKLKSKEIKVEVANLAFIHAKKAKLTLTIEDMVFTITVLVAKEEVECLLGRRGVFDNFDVIFMESERQVIFKKK